MLGAGVVVPFTLGMVVGCASVPDVRLRYARTDWGAKVDVAQALSCFGTGHQQQLVRCRRQWSAPDTFAPLATP